MQKVQEVLSYPQRFYLASIQPQGWEIRVQGMQSLLAIQKSTRPSHG